MDETELPPAGREKNAPGWEGTCGEDELRESVTWAHSETCTWLCFSQRATFRTKLSIHIYGGRNGSDSRHGGRKQSVIFGDGISRLEPFHVDLESRASLRASLRKVKTLQGAASRKAEQRETPARPWALHPHLPLPFPSSGICKGSQRLQSLGNEEWPAKEVILLSPKPTALVCLASLGLLQRAYSHLGSGAIFP